MTNRRIREEDLHLYRMQAETANVLANPVRLRILNLIGDREVPKAGRPLCSRAVDETA